MLAQHKDGGVEGFDINCSTSASLPVVFRRHRLKVRTILKFNRDRLILALHKESARNRQLCL